MTLDYVALAILVVVLLLVVYGVVAVWGIPYENRQTARPPASGRDRGGDLGQPVHARRIVAVPVDLFPLISCRQGPPRSRSIAIIGCRSRRSGILLRMKSWLNYVL